MEKVETVVLIRTPRCKLLGHGCIVINSTTYCLENACFDNEGFDIHYSDGSVSFYSHKFGEGAV